MSHEEKERFFQILGITPKVKPVKIKKVDLDIQSMAIIALEQHRKKMSAKK